MQTQHRFSVEDFHRMAETGVLHPGARVELQDGKIIDLLPIGPFHGGITNYQTQIFAAAAKGRWLLSVQNPLHLDQYSQPQPDLMLLKPVPDFYRKQHPQAEDVYLLIEVSDTTLDTDRDGKLPAYGRAGVAEVWIVNLNEIAIEIYREPHFTGYARKTILRAGAQASPLTFPDIAVNLSELFQR